MTRRYDIHATWCQTEGMPVHVSYRAVTIATLRNIWPGITEVELAHPDGYVVQTFSGSFWQVRDVTDGDRQAVLEFEVTP